VQNVLLLERTDTSVDTGLQIGTAGMEPDASARPVEGAAASDEGWFPPTAYDWEVREGAAGVEELLITVYPFYYNAATSEVEFYQSYDFEILSTYSTVSLTNVSVSAGEVAQGEAVSAEIEMNNAGEPIDVVVDASVQRYGTDELVDGLLLTTLHDLTGAASFAPVWESAGAEPGYYAIEVVLRDTEGDRLDRRCETFRLGVVSGTVTALEARPARFDVGETVTASMTFSNTGTVSITGTAFFEIWREGGSTAGGFQHEITSLPPGEHVVFEDGWDSAGELGGDYTVLGYVTYDSQSTPV
jgi:hypothetical protein